MPKRLIAGVEVHNGQILGSSGIGALLQRRARSKRIVSRAMGYHLHRRAAQVLRLIALGYSYKQIAYELGMGQKSAEQYIAKFKKRWAPGCPLTVLVGIAIREGLISPQELIVNAERYLKMDAL